MPTRTRASVSGLGALVAREQSLAGGPPGEAARVLEPERHEPLPLGQRALDRRGKRHRAERLGSNRRVPGRLVQRGWRGDGDLDQTGARGARPRRAPQPL